jgi:DNA invertase Pin-like site-specific DNA recombinase
VGYLFVAYRDAMVLRISQTATHVVSPPPESTSMSQLTLHASTERIALAEQCEVLCPATQPNSGINSPLRGKPVSALTSRRSSRRESMHNSHLITPQHLTRKAVIDIRQSPPHPVLSHQERLRLQYALHERARQLGWPDAAIDSIEDDLGLTAASAAHREGCNTLVAQVTLEQVGLILSYDVTRLSRNCSDWYPLLDLCGYKGGVSAESDGIYAPATVHGRLLLGLKGTLSAWERHPRKARLTAGRLHKAERGELALTLPTGLVRKSQGQGLKMPTQAAQARLALVFETFWQCRSASTVVDVFKHPTLCLPRRDRFGDLVWKAPRVASVLAMLKPPASAGACTYGWTRTLRREARQGRPTSTRLPQDQWRSCIPTVYPSSSSWETYTQIQAMRKDKQAEYDRNTTRGIPRPGKALLHGLGSCGACGHKRVVQYKGGTRYIGNYLRQPYRTPVCQYIAAEPVDTRVVDAFFQALAPVERDVYAQALAKRQPQAERLAHAHAPHLERLRYAAASCERQCRHVDPAHRHVAALEPAWEVALEARKRAEAAEAQRVQASTPPAPALSPALHAAFRAIGQQLPALWAPDVLAQTQRQALLRCLIDKVVIQRARRAQVHTRIVWRGGETTTFAGPVAVGALTDLPPASEMAPQIRGLCAAGMSDVESAQQLTRHGYRSPSQPAVLPSPVKGIRLKLGLMQNRSQSPPRRIAGDLTVPQLAKALASTPHGVEHQSKRGTVAISRDAATGLDLFPARPETLEAFRQLQAGHLSELRY